VKRTTSQHVGGPQSKLEQSSAIRLTSFVSCRLRAFAIGLFTGIASIAVATHAPAQATEQATLRLDWLASGYHGLFFLALERGFYREQGIDLSISDGKGSTRTIQVVASGTETFGFANLSATALGFARGMPLVAVAAVIQKSPDAIIALKGSGIKVAKDIEGKRGAFTPTGAADRLFPAFAKSAGVDMSRVTRIQIESSARYSVLLQGNADFVVGWSFDDGYKINKRKAIEPPILFSDNGVNVLGVGIITGKDTLTKRPDVVKRFLAASMKGLEEALKSPAAAVDAILKWRPDGDRDSLLAAAQGLHAFVRTANTASKPLGWMAKEDWAATRQILVEHLGMSSAVAIDRLSTNDFLSNQ
jgi:NitT/TauT family transport system substrate-binding protein